MTAGGTGRWPQSIPDPIGGRADQGQGQCSIERPTAGLPLVTDDIVIVGGGIGGLFTALRLAPRPVTVITAALIGEGASSSWAQGGIAAAMSEGDSVEKHLADTIAAGDGIVAEKVARLMISDAPDRVHDLLAYGVPFDRDLAGHLAMSREAAHSERRVVHVAGDMAGAAIMAALVAAVRKTPSIRLFEGFVGERLTTKGKRVTGLVARPVDGGAALHFPARAVVLASGGIGHLFAITTNPAEAAGGGMAMAARAGAVIGDPEFVQFHPTVLNVGRDPAPLATEALRGEGARLINKAGERFMLSVHPLAELAPRDVVARAVHAEVEAGRGAFLDCREAIGAAFETHFPTVYKYCREAGIDPVTQPIPIAPAEHYHMGGILTDGQGRATLDGLWACGECTSTGAHGANRLASNSLLEAIAFGARIADDLADHLPQPQRTTVAVAADARLDEMPDPAKVARLRQTMTSLVGVVREGAGMTEALATIDALGADCRSERFINMLTAARIIAAAALARTESRGGHFRSDYPDHDPAWKHRTYITLARAERDQRGGRRRAAAPGSGMSRPAVLPDVLIAEAVRAALKEDLGRAGDITSAATIPAEAAATADLVARKPGVIAGLAIAAAAFRETDPAIRFTAGAADGDAVEAGAVVATVAGPARAILSAERVALNFLCHLSGIATATAALVARARHTRARICDTRKTTPGLRAFEKYAVRCGGGMNHRFGLDDAILIKDNHIAVAGGVIAAIRAARAAAGHLVKVEIEIDTLDQLAEAMVEGPDAVLLDNMAPHDMREAVQLVAGRAVTEASGNVTLETVAAIAETGVDMISSGWITHSAPILDLALDVVVGPQAKKTR